MQKYTFRKATLFDRQAVIEFMNTHWGAKHPLVNDDTLCNYYFCKDDEFNFALCFAEDKIISVAGYIYANKKKTAAYVSIWCADKEYNGAGLELMDSLKSITGVDVLCCNNIRPNTLKFYEFLGYYTGKFTHAYLLSEKKIFNIADITKYRHNVPEPSMARLVEITEVKQSTLERLTSTLSVKKDLEYLKFRYFNYPFRKYRLFALQLEAVVGIFVLRLTTVGDACAIRLVDYIGDKKNIAIAGVALAKLLNDFNAEYLDFYCAGIEVAQLRAAGFNIRDELDDNIIPNYTEPLEKANIDFFYFTSKEEDFTMFRADGDGDRPAFNID